MNVKKETVCVSLSDGFLAFCWGLPEDCGAVLASYATISMMICLQATETETYFGSLDGSGYGVAIIRTRSQHHYVWLAYTKRSSSSFMLI